MTLEYLLSQAEPLAEEIVGGYFRKPRKAVAISDSRELMFDLEADFGSAGRKLIAAWNGPEEAPVETCLSILVNLETFEDDWGKVKFLEAEIGGFMKSVKRRYWRMTKPAKGRMIERMRSRKKVNDRRARHMR
jgi:hypothetical protein